MRTPSSHTGPGPWETPGIQEAQEESETLRGGMFSATSQCSGAQTTQDASVCRCQHELLTGNSFTGLGQGLRNQVKTGTLRKPSIWANPGPITTMGSSVTIWCRGSRQADAYRLYKEQDSQYWDTWPPRNSVDRASFFTESMDIHHAGQFQCAYHSSSGWSELSDPLLLVVTGAYSKPSLSAHPSHLVVSGGNVSLSCSSQNITDTFHLLKEREAYPSQQRKSEFSAGRHQATFPVGPVSTSHGGIYRCYGSLRNYPYVWSQPSDSVDLTVTGAYSKPSLSAHPSPLVVSGGSVSLSCSSQDRMDTFYLLKEGRADPPQHRKSQFSAGRHQAIFPMGPVSTYDGGTYRCYGSVRSSSHLWSHPSDPLDLKVTGTYEKPSLSAHPGPSVTLGDSVTLQCRSDQFFDTFHLFKEGLIAPPQQMSWQNNTGPFQTNFTMSPVTSAHGGTYRCYSSHSAFPYLLSQPSDPLELVVSGGSENQHHTPRDSDRPRGLPQYLKVLIGVLVAFVLLLVLFLLLFLLIRHHRQGKGRTTASEPKDRGLRKSSSPAAMDQDENLYAAVRDIQPEEEMEMDSEQSPEDQNPQARMCAQVNHHSRSRWAAAPCPSSLSGELQDMKDRQVEEDSQRDSQAAAPEDPQEVTYAQLIHSTLRPETTTSPSSQSGEPSNEPSVYAAVAIH
ncbi:leukocyte immunoglobulin-like receptor subfamily B member 3 isoform X4 [Elephas maximus indicus]|uniref:leukocyte immunoglobulin-like receptor subfamily B member 3 isoform X4 n=1 Tax=Elephas maximus indicus TaxID=99487 RepID=UPI002116005F|nr:leukocyte immunoglobulin-like receptor subfamily B member 3 isoform X4 [Elephas maximus indicus]